MSYLGDFRLGDTFDTKFCTVNTSGAPTTLAGTPVISAYVGNSLTQLTAGITLTVDFDGVTGLHHVRVVATSGNGYATASNYQLVITTGTVGGTSVVGYVIAEFSLEARSAVMPTTAARTLAVDASGRVDVGALGPDTGLQPIRTGTAQAGAAGSITLDAGASATNAFYYTSWIYITGGTGVGQVRLITGYTGASKVATVAPGWATVPDATSTFAIIPASGIDVEMWFASVVATPTVAGRPRVDVTHWNGSAALTGGAAGTVQADVQLINGSTSAADNLGNAFQGSATPTVTMNITGNVTGNLSGSVGSVTGNVGGNVVGSVASVTAGVTLAASAVQAIWDALTSALTTVGSIGKLLVDNINATISSRSDVTTAQVKTQITDALNVDTYAESSGVPASTATIVEKIGRLYMGLRNQVTVTATAKTFANDANAAIWKKTLSDDGTTYTETKGVVP